MQRILFTLSFLLLLPAAAQAEDSTPVLPPPAHVQPGDPSNDAGANSPASKGEGLSGELSTKGGTGDVQIYSSMRKDGTKVEEYAHHGHVYMIKVTPPHGAPPYYLYDDNGDGKFVRHLPGGFNHPTPPEWVIKKF